MRFYIVDVFAESRYSGNQLAVFRDSGTLSDPELLRIAQEMHYSETTFITSEKERDGGYDVRVFTPNAEIPFGGHPTLGTAYILQSKIIKKPVARVTLNLKVGQIPVTFSYKGGKASVLWMKQNEPSFGKNFDRRPVSEFLGLSLSDFDEHFPIMEVSTGLPFIIVPLKNLNAVRRVRLDQGPYLRFVEKTEAKNLLIFSPETYGKKNDLNARVLAPLFGVPEDPASGSGNGCLAAYLVNQRYFGKDEVDVRVEQGYEIGRKSLLFLKSSRRDGKIEVRVGGMVQFIARGDFLQ
jgi:trans-2,3-dihydro-3-hydroxyanthranilate isomerase